MNGAQQQRNIVLREKMNLIRYSKVTEHFPEALVLFLDHDRPFRLDRKFDPIWKGPYLVMRKVSGTRYLLRKLGEKD